MKRCDSFTNSTHLHVDNNVIISLNTVCSSKKFECTIFHWSWTPTRYLFTLFSCLATSLVGLSSDTFQLTTGPRTTILNKHTTTILKIKHKNHIYFKVPFHDFLLSANSNGSSYPMLAQWVGERVRGMLGRDGSLLPVPESHLIIKSCPFSFLLSNLN